MSRLITVLVLFSLLFPGLAVAQERLTLAQGIAEALERNPSLRAAAAMRDRAEAEVDVQHAALLPQLSWSESWFRGNQPVFAFGSLLNARQFTVADFSVDQLNHPDARGAFTNHLSLQQVLFDGGAKTGAADAARSERDAAGAALDRARSDVALTVTRAYGQALTADAAAASADAAIAGAEEDLARATRRRDVGTVTEADVLAIRVQVAALREQALQARGQAAIARADLNRLIGAPVDRVFLVEVPPPTDDAVPEMAALFAEAERTRPELREADAAAAKARASEKQAHAGWLPTIDALAAYELSGLSFGARASAWLVGGQARWNLSLGGGTSAATRAAAAALVAADAARTDVRAGVHVDVVRAVQHLNTARARTGVSRDVVAQAQERQRIVRNRYDAGVMSVNDVLSATTASLDAEAQRTNALVDLMVARAELLHALGRPPAPIR